MDSPKLKHNICRSCLDESVVLDWNTVLYGYCDVTYKDCFYLYTHLERLALDHLSPMLCQVCVNGLYNAHTLVLKALESHKYLCDVNFINKKDPSKATIGEVKYTTEFETILLDKIKVEPVIQNHLNSENTDALIVRSLRSEQCTHNTPKTAKQKKRKNKIGKSIKAARKIKKSIIDSDLQNYNPEFKKSQKKSTDTDTMPVVEPDVREKLMTLNDITGDKNVNDIGLFQDELLHSFIKDSDPQEGVKEKKRYKEIKKPRMCSICSKILHNIYAVRMHEKTHIENRERKETCKICGLKFYDKRNLYTHNRIHVENREKNHKCEFCNKAFYNKGGLNIHRRIHLGQMIPCNLCTKNFFRQIDLERHMSSHSAAAINSDAKKRSRYFVRCTYCGKSILSTSFKSHTAAHLNEPLMKCSICSKEFFRRGSCVLHVKKVHHKTNEEYNDFIIQYKKNRISHLFLEQKTDIQFTDA